MGSVNNSAHQKEQLQKNERLVELLGLCAQGNETAFAEVYHLSSSQLFGVMLRLLKIEAVAEEGLQEAFVKIWDNAASYNAELGTPIAWMYGIARNQALDLIRRRRAREDRESADIHGVIDSAPDIAKPLYEMSDDAVLLTQCLDKLPEDMRNCVVQAYCEGYSHEELMVQRNRPLGTIKSWIHRGLLSLRKCLDEFA